MTDEEFRGGLAPEQDLVLPGKPDNPEMRESVSVWLFEENGAFAFPRGGIEAEAALWDNRRFQANFSFADGRVLDGAGQAPPPSPIGADGRPTIIGAGPLVFQCIDPFKRWTMRFDGPARNGTVAEQIGGGFGQRGQAQVRLDVDMTMVTPAWVQQTATDTSNMSEAEAADAAAMGLGYRMEHLFRAVGTLHIDGRSHPFRGTGSRIHRQSIRSLTGFTGHCWLSAVFPDGRAFGMIVYPPRADGSEGHNEAYVYQNGRMYEARSIDTPFLRRIVDKGDELAITLESDLGISRITGTTLLSTFRVGNPDMMGLNLQQGGALYRWDDQTAYGMVERSSHDSLVSIG